MKLASPLNCWSVRRRIFECTCLFSPYIFNSSLVNKDLVPLDETKGTHTLTRIAILRDHAGTHRQPSNKQIPCSFKHQKNLSPIAQPQDTMMVNASDKLKSWARVAFWFNKQSGCVDEISVQTEWNNKSHNSQKSNVHHRKGEKTHEEETNP